MSEYRCADSAPMAPHNVTHQTTLTAIHDDDCIWPGPTSDVRSAKRAKISFIGNFILL